MPFDLQTLLRTLPFLLGGGQTGAVAEGYRRAQEKKQRDQQIAQQQAGQQQLQQAQMQNLEHDNARADQQAALGRISDFYKVAPGLETQAAATATDPVAANLGLAKQLTGAAQAFGVDPSLGASFVPNMTEVVSTRKKKKAADLYAQAEKIYGSEAMAQDSITLQTGPDLFGDVKPSALRAKFATPAVTPQGTPAAPAVKAPPSAGPGTFGEFVDAPPDRQAQILRSKAQYDAVNDTAKTPARDRFSVQPVTNADGTTALVRVNLETGESSPIALPSGVAGAGKPTPTEQLASAFQLRAQAADQTLSGFEDHLDTIPSQFELHLPPLLQSKNAQLYAQARDEFINAELRRESGAAIQPSEYARFDRIYAVQTGDRPENIRQKREARRRVILGNQMAGGNLGKIVAGQGEKPVPSHGGDEGSALQILEQRRRQRGGP